MKMNGKWKKRIVGLLGVGLAVGVFATEIMTNMTDVQATTKVFTAITDKYGGSTITSKPFTILEIEPDGSIYTFTDEREISVSQHAELGYFMSTSLRRNLGGAGDGLSSGLPIAALGGVHGSPATGMNDATYPDQIYQLRMFGLVKPNGMDSQGISTKIPEYPMFSETAVFSNYYNDVTKYLYASDKALAKGVYTMVESGGDYRLHDGYKLDDKGRICEVTVSQNEVPVIETVSGQDVQTGTKMEETEVLVPVDDIDMSTLQLPTSATKMDGDGKLQYIVKVENGTGNLAFKRSEKATTMQEYWGLTDLALYYATDSNAKFYNSDWFREYVFGDNQTYAKKTINYQMKAASEVKEADLKEADLIYINGSNQAFVNGSDISLENLTTLYNLVIKDHKALMMDYAAYDASLSTNVSKLALLLWQAEQSSLVKAADGKEIFTTTAVAENKDADDSTQISELVDADKLFKDQELVELLKGGVLSSGNGNFVTGNVYVYNHHMSDFVSPKSMVDAYDNFANGDFNSAYTDTVVADGFSPILSYINITNKNSMSGEMANVVTPAVAIQYILISDGNGISVVKNSLNILEIEPTTRFLYNGKYGSEDYTDLEENIKSNRDAFISKNLSAYYADKAKYISFESMTIDEFNGRNEDLIENYDIIYIGSEIGSIPTLCSIQMM